MKFNCHFLKFYNLCHILNYKNTALENYMRTFARI